MKTIRITATALLLASLLPVTVTGQQKPSPMNTVTGNLLRYTTENPFEEIFLHTDRETYAAGETVRFTAWLFSYPDMRLTDRNSYAYVELLDYYGNPVSQAVARLEKGKGESMMTLPDTLVTGSYLLRAYTSVTRNYMPYGCFMKKITVANPFRSDYLDFYTIRKFADEEPYRVSFFPEGGTMVNGISSRIGVFAVNKYGYPVRCEAEVVNSSGEPVARVNTDINGTGSFEFTPASGERCFLVPLNKGPRFELPAPAENGITMGVTYGEDKSVRILLSEKHEGDSRFTEEGFLVIQSRGRVIHSLKLPEWNNKHEIDFPAARLKEGMINIACFDRDGNFVAERYLFLPAAAGIIPRLTVTGGEGRRKKTGIEIALAGEENAGPLRTGSISVSCISSADRIVTLSEYLMSGSEFYYDCTMPGVQATLAPEDPRLADDYLLGIKSAWIDWKKISAGSWESPLYPAETDGRYFTVSQTLPSSATDGSYPAASQTLHPADPYREGRIAWLTSWGATQSFQYAESDGKGRFRFFLGEATDPVDIVVKTDGRTNHRPMKIESAFSDRHLFHPFTPDTTSFLTGQSETGKITDRYQIGRIYGLADSAASQPARSGNITVRRFYGIPDQEINLDDYISLSSMREIFFEIVKRIVVRSRRSGEGYEIWEPVLKRTPALFIDQVPVDDAETVLGLDPVKVQRIDVISGDYQLGDIVFPGIVSVVTRKGNFTDTPLPPGAMRTPFSMSDQSTPFATPDYSDTSTASGRIPDFRNTAYWNGNLEADSTAILRCSFWSPDDAGEYVVTVNTVDDSGRPVSLTQKIRFPGL